MIADPLHLHALEEWPVLERQGARLVTSVPVVLETYAFLNRKTS